MSIITDLTEDLSKVIEIESKKLDFECNRTEESVKLNRFFYVYSNPETLALDIKIGKVKYSISQDALELLDLELIKQIIQEAKKKQNSKYFWKRRVEKDNPNNIIKEVYCRATDEPDCTICNNDECTCQ